MKYESVFELQVFQGQAESTKKLIKRYPEINFILQHAGMPHDLSEDRMKEWYDFIGNISEFDNLFIKLSGLGTFINKNDPKFINEIVNKVLNIYNSNRCLFGSNFPIEKIWCNYSDIIEAYQFATQKLQMSDKKNIFYETANRLYRL
jgi:predicted TIM-barrel fold metal-dependent hydrolase